MDIIKWLKNKLKPKPHKCPFYFYGNCGIFEKDPCPYTSRNEHHCWLNRITKIKDSDADPHIVVS